MGYWGKIIGGTAGFFVGGPYGAVIGAALGHAADSGTIQNMRLPFGQEVPFSPARIAGMFGKKEEIFAITVTVLAAKLCKTDGPVSRLEIDAFKRNFRIPPESSRNVGRLFDQARDSADPFEPYAVKLGETFSDNLGTLEEVLNALFLIARADGSLNAREENYLRRVQQRLGLDEAAWDRAFGGASRQSAANEDDPYQELGLSRSASREELRTAWKRLMRENHPDTLAARGVPQDFVARASDKVARINAAWDRIKRERGL
jgi:DnaJ like chaperone protein